MAAPVLADSPGGLVSKGNRSFERGEFEQATGYYDRASVRAPESPVVAFNLGNVFYRTGEYSRARERFEDAALKTRDLALEAKAWYNMGNCAFREGERQTDSDLEKALEQYKESVQFYMTALEKDPDLEDAAHNLEVARLVIKDLLDKIKQQQEMMQEQQERLQEVVDSLLALTERQEQAIGTAGGLAQEQARKPNGWRERLTKLERKQDGIHNGTAAVGRKLEELFPGDQRPQPVQEALSHLDTAAVETEEALADLSAEDPSGAMPDQELALEQLKRALEKLTEGQQPPQDQQGPQQQQEQAQQQEPQQQEQEQRQPQDETAQGILEEEKENRKRRQRASGGYRAVDKDW
jgi:tetratricopeptide (TPR) repeat protein